MIDTDHQLSVFEIKQVNKDVLRVCLVENSGAKAVMMIKNGRLTAVRSQSI